MSKFINKETKSYLESKMGSTLPQQIQNIRERIDVDGLYLDGKISETKETLDNRISETKTELGNKVNFVYGAILQIQEELGGLNAEVFSTVQGRQVDMFNDIRALKRTVKILCVVCAVLVVGVILTWLIK